MIRTLPPRVSAPAVLAVASRLRTIALLCTAVLGLPVVGLRWELHPQLVPVLWCLGLVSLYVVVTWPLRTALPRLVKALATLVLFGVGGMVLFAALLFGVFTGRGSPSLTLADGCRVDTDWAGGLGDSDLHLVHRCPVGLLWSRSTPLLSDSEATVSQLREAAPGHVSVTLSRYGKPDEQRVLRLPSR